MRPRALLRSHPSSEPATSTGLVIVTRPCDVNRSRPAPAGPNLMAVGSFWRIGHRHWPPPLMQSVCSEPVEQDWPFCVPPSHVDKPQSGSAQSISPSQSLSIMSAQPSGPVGTQPSVVVVVGGVVVVVVTHRMWFWSQLPFGSQPAVVQLSASVSGQGVLSGFGVSSPMPVIWLRSDSTQSVEVQTGQRMSELDCWPDELRPLSQLASFWDAR